MCRSGVSIYIAVTHTHTRMYSCEVGSIGERKPVSRPGVLSDTSYPPLTVLTPSFSVPEL